MLRDVIGNREIKEVLAFKIQAAQAQKEPISHMLLEGSSGCGKTSTARAIAKELQADLFEIAPSSLKGSGGIYRIVEKIVGPHSSPTNSHRIVLIDEAHSLRDEIQEELGVLMEDYVVSNEVCGVLYSERIPRFSLFAATTHPHKLTAPFRNRFPLSLHFQPYSLNDSIEIVRTHAWRLGVSVEIDAAEEIGKRSKGIGRLAVNYLKNILDFTIARHGRAKIISGETARETFALLEVDKLGLTLTDRKVLSFISSGSGRPIGLQLLASLSGQDQETITEMIEPYLLAIGFVVRTPKGRILTEQGRSYLREAVNTAESKVFSSRQTRREFGA